MRVYWVETEIQRDHVLDQLNRNGYEIRKCVRGEEGGWVIVARPTCCEGPGGST